MPVFSATSDVDFDGKNKATKDITTSLHEESPNFATVPAKTSADLQLVKKLGIIDENGIFAELAPIKTWRGDDGIIRTEYQFWPDQKIHWTLECNGTSQPTWNGKQTYTFTSDQNAGHLHYDPIPPPYKVSTVYDNTSSVPPDVEFYPRPSPFFFPDMPVNAKKYYWEWMPVFATQIVEQFESFGACVHSQIDIIDVQVPKLMEMKEGPNYILNKTAETIKYHPKCHNGTQALIDTLTSIADQYKAAFPTAGVIVINHMSLPWGGKFDLERKWGVDPKEDHQGHQYGIEADISKANVPLQNRKTLLEIMCKNTALVYSEVPSCYHIRAKTAKIYPDDFDIAKSTITECCRNGVVNPNNMNTCVQD